MAAGALARSGRGLAVRAASALQSRITACGATPSAAGARRATTQVQSQLTLQEEGNPFLKYTSPVPQPFRFSAAAPATRVTVLPSGLRIATEAIPFSETATVGVWIDAGSRYETDKTNGTAHFLEHMAFKGTARRSTRTLEEEIENMGGHLNAYTSREQTTYYAKVLKKNVPAAVDILSDILQNSTLDDRAVANERSVILREMEEVEGQTDEVLFDHLHATAFQYSPLGRTILGPADNIRAITRGDLADYIATHYTAPRMVVAASGAVDHDELVGLVEKAFNKLPTDPTTASDLVRKSPAFFTGSEVRIRDDDMPQLHFAIAVKGAAWTDPDSVPLMVMQTMLGAWDKNASGGKNMGSELAQKIASNQLANSYTAFSTNYTDTGLFGVYAICEKDVAQDCAWSIMREMSRMIYRPNPEEVTRACNQLKATLLLHLDGTSPITEDIGRQMLTYGRRVPLAELFARIDAVDTETVKAVAERFIYDKELAVAAIGPVQELPDYNWLRRRTYWLSY
eukprot:jgi/Chlat1/2100/Chrsp17S02695